MNTDPTPTSLREAVKFGSGRLESMLESQLLLAFCMRKDRGWLYAHLDEACPAEAFEHFARLVDQRQAGEPMAYLTGEKEFFSRSFRVGPDVLIPRPETELLVERALMLESPADARVLDIGTGSGCIAITLCLERPEWRVSAVDTSMDALAVASANRDQLEAVDLELIVGSLFEAVAGRHFDLIVSNPPYVAAGDEHLAQGDVRFEPDLALVGGSDGLDLIRLIVAQAPDHLEPGGWLLLEHGHDQAAAVRNLLEVAGFERIESCCDLAGIERVSFGMKT